MYPRNAASPERIAIGAVVQISDGAVQTSGVSISVRGQGGASGAGSGTTEYDNGIVEYTPTQGETDFTSFIVVAYKTGCIPASQTIVTSASATAGYAGTDQSKIANATATVDLSNTTIKNLDGNTVQTGDAYARIGAAGAGLTALGDTRLANLDAAVSTRLASASYTAPDNTSITNIKTQTDKLTFTVANQIDANVLDWKSSAAPAMTGDAYARIGAAGAGLTALGDTRIANLDATVSSRLASASYTAPPSAADNADAVWDEAIAGHLTGGTTGAALNAAGAAGDPWSTPLPGAYGDGTAGKIVGVNLDAQVSTSGGGLDAAGVRDAVGLAAANLDTQLTPLSNLDATVSSIPTAIENADALLNRDMSTGTDSGSATVRTVRQALRILRNKFTLGGGALAVYKEDDATLSWSSAITSDANAEPVVGSDPAGP